MEVCVQHDYSKRQDEERVRAAEIPDGVCIAHAVPLRESLCGISMTGERSNRCLSVTTRASHFHVTII